MCRGKHRVVTEAFVRSVAAEMNTRGDRVVPYRCPLCCAWHVGHLVPVDKLRKVLAAARALIGGLDADQRRDLVERWAPPVREETSGDSVSTGSAPPCVQP
jgi:hypothetical protein